MFNTKGFFIETGEWNDSLTGNFLWSSTNIGETLADVQTPFTWSLISAAFEQMNVLPDYPLVGNIGGRGYNNVSALVTAMAALGRKIEDMNAELGGVREEYKANLPKLIPRLPKPALLPLLWRGVKIRLQQARAMRAIPSFLRNNPGWCRSLIERSDLAAQNERVSLAERQLEALMSRECLPVTLRSFWMVLGTAMAYGEVTSRLRRKLVGLVGAHDSELLLSNVSLEADLLASLGPVVGLAQVRRGELSQQAFLQQWGHRGPHESELSTPRPVEDPNWLDQQLAALERSPLDVEALLSRRRAEFEAALERFGVRHPALVNPVKSEIEKAAQAARLREAVRSEVVRCLLAVRRWALRAGEVSGLGEGIFFLTIEEALNRLRGDEAHVKFIPARREMFERYRELPPYPMIIRGSFDPFQWAADPNRRSDFAETDAVMGSIIAETERRDPARAGTIYGAPGSAGIVEGLVRRLDKPEQGAQLQPGEILVTTQTNVGWTHLFPLAKAIVTDIGAALSHAAIVAREMGIPAVVNCGDATRRLKTGDRVRVDGSAGTVTLLTQETQ